MHGCLAAIAGPGVGHGVRPSGDDGRRAQRADAGDDEVGLGADARFGDGRAPGSPIGGADGGDGHSASSCKTAFAEPPQWPQPQAGARRFGPGDALDAAGSRRHVRAATDRKAPTPRTRLRREDPRSLRQGDDHPRHPRDRARALRRGGLGDARFGDYRGPRCRSDGLADPAALGRLADCVLRRNHGSRPGANGRVSQHTIYVALGVDLAGQKELLGLWLGENEGAKFWLSCLTDLKNRGLRDIFVACIDGLSGFAEAIHAAYPQTSVQLCIVHLVRAALRYVSTEDSKLVARDLKKIYQAATVLEAEAALEQFAQAWDAKYPTIAKQWRAKWADIITLFDFPAPIRKAIYTTNAIESVNSVIRKFTRNRKIYPNEESALKLVFMAIREASKKWTMPIHHWKQALNHFAILYEDRMPELTNS